MPPSSDDAAPPHWAAWLRALWGEAAAIERPLRGGTRPVLTGRDGSARTLHLAAEAGERLAFAAAAHAAAHWRFGGPPQARAGLKPVQQALYGVLEDARVEALALRELPGLRALWLPFHAGEDAPAGNGCEALLARLARSLLEHAPADPHPWIARARAFVFAPDGTLALTTPDTVRAAASRLGNDIGQMRLPFNAATYVVHAACRDDGSWLWEPEAHAPDSQTTLVQPAVADASPAGPADAPPQDAHPTACYPEWDARIARYRADWCRVHVRDAHARPGDGAHLRPPQRTVRRLQAELAQLRGPLAQRSGRDAHGDALHAVAAVEAQVQRRAGHAPDERVYRRRHWPQAALAVQLLLDASASTGDPGRSGQPLLAELLRTALACSQALEACGHRSALMAFRSRTRAWVEVRPLKRWDEPACAPVVLARCAGEHSNGSTRTGAALRHAVCCARAFAEANGRQAVVLVLTDGDLHDVDAPDPAYLRGDLRRAVGEAAASGVPVLCLRLGGTRSTACGWREAVLAGPHALPQLLTTLLAHGLEGVPTMWA